MSNSNHLSILDLLFDQHISGAAAVSAHIPWHCCRLGTDTIYLGADDHDIQRAAHIQLRSRHRRKDMVTHEKQTSLYDYLY